MRRLLEDKDLVPMDPWYTGFKGKIEKSEKEGIYKVSGAVTYINDDTFVITELRHLGLMFTRSSLIR